MVSNDDLKELVKKARAKGAKIIVNIDEQAFMDEGRSLIDTIIVSEARGIGPYPMSPITAAEALRRYLAPIERYRTLYPGSKENPRKPLPPWSPVFDAKPVCPCCGISKDGR